MALARYSLAAFAGVVVVVLLLPVRGVDSDPPVCWSVFDYEVPCGAGLSLAAGAAVAVAIGLIIWLYDRRKAARG